MKALSVVIGLLAGLLFGIATPLSKIILSHLNSFQLAGLLYLGAAIAFLPFVVKNRKTELKVLRQTGKKKQLPGIILFGGILGPLFLMIGLRMANSMSVSVWLNFELVATAILGVLFFKEQLGRFGIIGVLFTVLAGVIASAQESGSSILSGLFILLACVSWGVDNHLTAIVDGVSPQTITFIKGLFGGATNFIIGMAVEHWSIQTEYIPAALLLGIFSYGISIVFYVISAQNLGATRSQILFSTAPFWGILAAGFFLGEAFGVLIFIAITFLILGIVFSNLSSHEHAHVHSKIVHIHMHSHEDDHHNHQHTYPVSTGIKHTHLHEHEDIMHSHIHFPDLHHRHKH